MSKRKLRPIRMVSYEGIFLIFLSWVVKKFLDFVWKKSTARLRFGGKTHLKQYLFVMFGNELLMFIFGWLLGTPKDTNASEFGESVDRFLKLHRRYHQYIGRRPCSACYGIYWNRNLFEKLVPDPKLARARAEQFSALALAF